MLMVGRTFSYFGLGLIFWSMGGILGFCFGLILRTSMLAALKEGRKDSIIRGLPKKVMFDWKIREYYTTLQSLVNAKLSKQRL